VVLSFPLRGL